MPPPADPPSCRRSKTLLDAQARLQALPEVQCLKGEPDIEEYHRLALALRAADRTVHRSLLASPSALRQLSLGRVVVVRPTACLAWLLSGRGVWPSYPVCYGMGFAHMPSYAVSRLPGTRWASGGPCPDGQVRPHTGVHRKAAGHPKQAPAAAAPWRGGPGPGPGPAGPREVVPAAPPPIPLPAPPSLRGNRTNLKCPGLTAGIPMAVGVPDGIPICVIRFLLQNST